MKLLHTADWQLGMRAAQAGERAPEVRAERLSAVERTIDLALQLEVDLVLVAGDVFEHQEIGERLLADVIGQLSRLRPTPIALLPGNHDPLAAGGVWARRIWSELEQHAVILERAEEIEILPGVALYPCPLRQKRSGQDPTAWIPPRSSGDARLRIGVAHGALDSLQVVSNFPISRDRAELADLDYLALGDWHGVLVRGRTAYPGAFEQASFGEKLPGYVLAVELDPSRSSPPRIEQHRIGRFNWGQIEAEIHDVTDIERLRSDIAELGAPGDTLVRVWARASGLDESSRTALEQLEREILESTFFVEWRTEHREIAPWSFEDGVLADVDATLGDLVRGHDPPDGLDELASTDPEILREARLSLRRLVSGALEQATAKP